MKKEELVIGSTYFLVTYLDQDLLVPTIRTYICLGKDALGESDAGIFFQEAEKYFDLGRWVKGKNALDYGVAHIANDMLDCIHDYRGLQHELELMIRGGAYYHE